MTLHLPERDIPIPTSVSPEAQAVLAMPPMEASPRPPIDDVAGWRALVKEYDEVIINLMGGQEPPAPLTTEVREVDGVPVHEIVPEGVDDDDRRVFLDIHGGAFVFGGGEVCGIMSARTAIRVGTRVWSVDYRMPPDHPFPAGLEDCLTVYRALLTDHDPTELIVGGASAGGNLAAAMVLRARDEGLPLPAAVVLMTPGSDLTSSGDSWQTNLGLDPLLTGDGDSGALALYAGGHDRTDPYVSPVYGDFGPGFPPTILTTGTRDRLLSDTVRLHRAMRKAGVDADLHVTEAGGHGGFLGMAPEDAELEALIREFTDAHWGA